jgi:galactokinase
MVIRYKDLGTKDTFDIERKVEYAHGRNYVRSAFNVLKRQGMVPASGWSMHVRGSIPIAGGLSSSSALAVASVLAFSKMAGESLNTKVVAELAFQAEVREFGESGGMMDHYASAYGGIIHLTIKPEIEVTRIPVPINGLVIGDSGEKKSDTVGDLAEIRNLAERGYHKISQHIEGFDQNTTALEEIQLFLKLLTPKEQAVVETTLRNRDLTRRAYDTLKNNDFAPEDLGTMIDQHHFYLRDGLKRSTKKIEKMIRAAKKAGALGCKINGSGGGGTMLAYCPGREDAVSSAIERAGGTPGVVSIAPGAHLNIQD